MGRIGKYPREYMLTAEVAKRLGISPATLRNWVNGGRIPEGLVPEMPEDWRSGRKWSRAQVEGLEGWMRGI